MARYRDSTLLCRRCRAFGVKAAPNRSGYFCGTWQPRTSPWPVRESNPKGEPMGVRAKEDGKSQCRLVMSRIRVPATAVPARKRADVHLVFHCERFGRIFEDGKANDGEINRCVHPRLRREKTPVAYRKGCMNSRVFPKGMAF